MVRLLYTAPTVCITLIRVVAVLKCTWYCALLICTYVGGWVREGGEVKYMINVHRIFFFLLLLLLSLFLFLKLLLLLFLSKLLLLLLLFSLLLLLLFVTYFPSFYLSTFFFLLSSCGI